MSKEVGPEDRAKNIVSEWLTDNGASVYWEKRNSYEYRTFHINADGAQKPDLVVDFGDRVFACEAKHGESKSGVYDATVQLQRYWNRYATRDQQYICGATAVDIDGFLTVTKHSPDGHLFNNDCEVHLTAEQFSDGRKRGIQNGEIPPTEYSMTEQHSRVLWRLMSTAAGDAGDLPGIGVLLSTALHPNWDRNHAPAVLWKQGKQQRWDVFNNGR